MMNLRRCTRVVCLGIMAVFFFPACGVDESTPDASEGEAMARLSGTVIYRERIPLRLDAVITVRLQDISLADAPAMLLAEQRIEAKGQSVPIPFSLEYDPSRIDERMSYAVRAEIRDGGGSLLWTSDTVHPVLTRDAPMDNVEIMVVAVPR